MNKITLDNLSLMAEHGGALYDELSKEINKSSEWAQESYDLMSEKTAENHEEIIAKVWQLHRAMDISKRRQAQLISTVKRKVFLDKAKKIGVVVLRVLFNVLRILFVVGLGYKALKANGLL